MGIAKDIIERDRASIGAINDQTDPNGMMHGYKLFGGMSLDQIQRLPEEYQCNHLIAIYETRVLGKIDHIGVCVYCKETKKHFMNIGGLWKSVPVRGDSEVRPNGYFTPDVNCVRLGSNMEDGPWYFISTPTKEQYEALVSAKHNDFQG